MRGNRKHGFARGSTSGRNGAEYWCFTKKWHCDVCDKEHGPKVERTGYRGKIM